MFKKRPDHIFVPAGCRLSFRDFLGCEPVLKELFNALKIHGPLAGALQNVVQNLARLCLGQLSAASERSGLFPFERDLPRTVPSTFFRATKCPPSVGQGECCVPKGGFSARIAMETCHFKVIIKIITTPVSNNNAKKAIYLGTSPGRSSWVRVTGSNPVSRTIQKRTRRVVQKCVCVRGRKLRYESTAYPIISLVI